MEDNNWSCLPKAVALLLQIPFHQLLLDIGHDGSTIVFPDESEPLNRRGFYIEEINIVLVQKYAKVLAPFSFPGSPGGDFEMIYDGILLGRSIGSSSPEDHAVIWKAAEKKIIDPNGSTYRINNFKVEAYFVIKDVL